MTHYFIIPGYQGSEQDHWQTWIESKGSNFRRIQQRDWNNPDISEWASNINKAISGFDPGNVILVAHSLGCHAVAEWVKKYNRRIRAALLVAPPDAELVNARIKSNLIETERIIRFPFKSTVVASSSDPWISIEKASFYARNWGGEFINIGDAGHINSLSGHGEWEQGYDILKNLS